LKQIPSKEVEEVEEVEDAQVEEVKKEKEDENIIPVPVCHCLFRIVCRQFLDS